MSPDQVRAILDEVSRLSGKFDTLAESFAELNHHITGNGMPERGMLIRLDRVEQRMSGIGAAVKWGFSVLGTLIAGVIVKLIAFWPSNR